MLVYIANFVSITILFMIAEHFNKMRSVRICSFLYAWLQLSLIAALRWGVGYDYNQYFNTFYEISGLHTWAELAARREEIGFVLFNKGMTLLTNNVILYLFVYYGILYGLLLVYIYRYSEVKWSSLFLYIALDYFAVSLCFMRQSMAMVIGLFAIEMIKRQKPLCCILLTFLAATFHSSALILLVALAFSYLDFTNRKLQIGAAISAIVIYVGCDFILKYALVGPFEKYKGYLDSFFMTKNHVFSVYFQLLIWILLLIMHKQWLAQDEENKRLLPVMCLGAFLALMTTRHYIIERMSLYLTVYNIRIGAQLLNLFQKDRFQSRMAVIGTLAIGFGAFIFLLRADRYGITPYQFNQGYFQTLLQEMFG